MEICKRSLLRDAEVSLWDSPSVADIATLVAYCGFEPDEVRLTGIESGGLQVFLDENTIERLGIVLDTI